MNSSRSSKNDRKSVCYRTFSGQGSQHRFVSLLSGGCDGQHRSTPPTKGSLGSLGTLDFGGDLTTLQNSSFLMDRVHALPSPDFLRTFPPQEELLTVPVQKSLVVKGGKAKDFGSCQFSPRMTEEAICIVRAAMREHHRLDALNNRNVFSHRSGGWKHDLWAGLVSLAASLLGLQMGHLLAVSSHGLLSVHAHPRSHQSMTSFNLWRLGLQYVNLEETQSSPQPHHFIKSPR